MNNKIIIDGIDITECQNCNSKNKKCTIPHWIGHIKCTSLNCSGIKDCYFKQLKRAEQACEELKKQYNCYACGTCNGKEDYKNMQRHCEKAIIQNHKYKQALDEIEKIINKMRGKVILTFPDLTQEENLKGVMEQCNSGYADILNIINKSKEQ